MVAMVLAEEVEPFLARNGRSRFVILLRGINVNVYIRGQAMSMGVLGAGKVTPYVPVLE
jgi:hypothetical protein